MGWSKKEHTPYLTAADKDRIARISDNDRTRAVKCHRLVTLVRNGCDQEVCINMYGETDSEIDAELAERLAFFQASDKSWRVKSDITVEKPVPFQKKEDY